MLQISRTSLLVRMISLRLHAGIDAGKEILPDVEPHNHLFERRIPGALAKAVYRAFDLPRAVRDRSERVGGCHAEIVVAVDRDYRLVNVRNPVEQGVEDRPNCSGVV